MSRSMCAHPYIAHVCKGDWMHNKQQVCVDEK